ncbi:LptF/LptG family permease, partial [bacterium]|nr:LptF/LptG family permease [bacterium]
FALLLLAETLDTGRFDRIERELGEVYAWLAMLTSATRWSIKSLSVTVLVGAIVGLLEFQSQREFVVMKAAGISIWRIMVGPIAFVILLGLVVTLAFETASTSLNREINPTPPGLGGGVARATSNIWLAQESELGPYILSANGARERGQVLRQVTLFPRWEADFRRATASRANFVEGEWRLRSVILTQMDGSTQELERFNISTESTAADLRLNVGSTEDFTVYELVKVLQDGITEPVVRAAALTRLLKLASLPLMLVGSLLIAFAFTSGFRRDNNYRLVIIYGIVLGFVVFVLTEMADRAGSSGVLDAGYATWGPALVSILIGVSVLLHKEDGRA